MDDAPLLSSVLHESKDEPIQPDVPHSARPSSLRRSTVPQGKKGECRQRLIGREGVFSQSTGKFRIARKVDPAVKRRLYWESFYNTALHVDGHKVIVGWMLIYATTVVFYAALWGGCEAVCGIELSSEEGVKGNFIRWLFFSLETMTTIGYGTPPGLDEPDNPGGGVFFNDCWYALLLLYLQSLTGVLFDSLTLGVVFQRVSRATKRASTIIFSNKACVQQIKGSQYFSFQVCGLRKHQVLEAKVRLYCIRHVLQPDGTMTYFQCCAMRLEHPDDELGGSLLLTLPQRVVHRIDAWSPLCPYLTTPEGHHPEGSYLFPEPLQRQTDRDNGNRERGAQSIRSTGWGELQGYWTENSVEVIVLVEGIDAVTSDNFQARHSYTIEDTAWGHTFEQCVGITENGSALIDFDRFHLTFDLQPREDVDSAWHHTQTPSHS